MNKQQKINKLKIKGYKVKSKQKSMQNLNSEQNKEKFGSNYYYSLIKYYKVKFEGLKFNFYNHYFNLLNN
jgi:hypothetical protein